MAYWLSRPVPSAKVEPSALRFDIQLLEKKTRKGYQHTSPQRRAMRVSQTSQPNLFVPRSPTGLRTWSSRSAHRLMASSGPLLLKEQRHIVRQGDAFLWPMCCYLMLFLLREHYANVISEKAKGARDRFPGAFQSTNALTLTMTSHIYRRRSSYRGTLGRQWTGHQFSGWESFDISGMTLNSHFRNI